MKIENYEINNYRIRKFNKNNLITTDDGSWTFLNDAELAKLKKGSFDKNLMVKLKKTGVILTKNKEEVIENTRKRFRYLFQGTSLHIVIPTLRCNYKCTYCHASSKDCNSKKFDMNEKTAKKAVDFIFQSPAKNIAIEFQGGEPLLNFEILKFITEYAKKKNKEFKKEVKIILVSNLSLLDDKKTKFLIKENISICTSLDGPKEVHDKNRKFLSGTGSYATTIEKIKYLNEKGIKVNALTTITKNSLGHHKEIIDEYVSLDLNPIHIRSLDNLGYANNVWKDISYTPEEFVSFWKKSLDYILFLNKKGIKIVERTAAIMCHKIFSVDPNFLDLRNPCGAAIGQLLYNYDGNIFTCDEGRMVDEEIFKIGDVTKKYKDVLTCPQTCAIVSASINDTTHCDFCAYKPYCGLCPVCNYAEHGNILAQIPATRRCKILKAQFDYIFELIQNKENKEILTTWINIV
ncbi:MAG: His-Xaa-Ser system radical SAM maturase HxsB [Nanoarchaeota archaeon]|nr:His-Xaa-Ser system radical SAM maturase HxsB [Nanoarchaeota archaeon]